MQNAQGYVDHLNCSAFGLCMCHVQASMHWIQGSAHPQCVCVCVAVAIFWQLISKPDCSRQSVVLFMYAANQPIECLWVAHLSV